MAAIVTGAARGLGAAHARTLAARGAYVVVNDLPPQPSDDDGASVATLTDDIVERGGHAVGVEGSITDGPVRAELVATAVEQFGRLDIVINNAGVLFRDRVGQLDADHLELEFGVTVTGALLLVDQAWPYLAERGGSVVSTTSGIGLFGAAGAVGYATAKMALVGANRTLALEGRECGIRSNLVAPIAATRMAGGAFGELTPHLDPEFVSAVVAWLAHPSCPLSGEVLSTGGGRVARAATTIGVGAHATSAEDVAACWSRLIEDDRFELDSAIEEVALIDRVINATR